MDRELEALDKARSHVADVAKLAKAAEGYLKEGRFKEGVPKGGPVQGRCGVPEAH